MIFRGAHLITLGIERVMRQSYPENLAVLRKRCFQSPHYPVLYLGKEISNLCLPLVPDYLFGLVCESQ